MSNAEYDGFRKSFSMADAIRLNWSNIKIDVGVDHTTATVTTDGSQEFTPKGDKKALKRPDHTVFHMIKDNGGTWVIKDRQ